MLEDRFEKFLDGTDNAASILENVLHAFIYSATPDNMNERALRAMQDIVNIIEVLRDNSDD